MAAIGVALLISAIVCRVLRSPFIYPYFVHEFDITEISSPNFDDFIDRMLIAYGTAGVHGHLDTIRKWREESLSRVNRSLLKSYRMRQYLEATDDENACVFYFTFRQVMDCEVKGKKMVCVDNVRVDSHHCSCEYLLNRYARLKEMDFTKTLSGEKVTL